MSDAAHDPSDYCYRHPDRKSYVLCQRCGRTICPECQTQAAVGVHCPECVREARQDSPRRAPGVVAAFRSSSNQPVVTYSLIALNVIVYVLQVATSQAVTNELAYIPVLTESRPWTMLTAAFVHGSPIHLLVNMYSLFVIGPALERALGRIRYVVLYLVAALGGSVAVLLLAPQGAVLGASGAIFGLLGAFFVIQRRLGGNNVQIIVVIVLNLAIGFFIPGISWQAHVGGLVLGAAVAFVYLQTRRPNQRNAQILMLTGIVIALIAITVVRVLAF
ncbi:MAG: rhomboid family intramembrane serine protease [Rhodoglobus sp.]